MSDLIPTKNLGDNQSQRKGQQTVAVDLYASRKKIYVKEIKGFFQRIRTVSLWALMAAYFLLPWVSLDGQQLLYFDLPARKFHIFGTTFWPQDFVLLAWILIICAFGLFFITTLFGRIWCGYTCPQTAWTFIFMWLEEKIEGSRNQRMKLDQAPASREKIVKKTLKHASWLFVALATGITFVGYFYPIRELVPDLFTLSASSGWAYFWVLFFTVATYLNAGWMREQVCLYMCPYARFQSAMFDPDTMVVSYDPNRGEPRGKRKRGVSPGEQGLGDCVDCNMCVQVCPTGIDIRDGLQYECIGCALCIDACDQIMEKMEYPKGLIRYTTENELEGKKSHILRPKSVGYFVTLMVMIFAVVHSVATRIPLELDVLRDRGALYNFNTDGEVENNYTLKIINMADTPKTFNIEVTGIEGIHLNGDSTVSIGSGKVASVPVTVNARPDALKAANTTIHFTVTDVADNTVTVTTESRFLGPPPGY